MNPIRNEEMKELADTNNQKQTEFVV